MAEPEESTNGLEREASGFQSFENAAADIVLAAAHNSTGTRIALAAADHKLRVYNIKPDNEWTLFGSTFVLSLDSKIHWVDSSLGQFLATIGSDNKFKIWREDPSQVHTWGRRFKCIFAQSPANRVSYVSFEFAMCKQDLYLTLVSHDGLLCLLEPTEPEALNSWREIDAFYPFGQHPRGSEPRFSLSFHRSHGPSTQALRAGLDANALSVAVSAGNLIKVYRGIKSNENIYQLQEMAFINLETSLINEIAWAPGCLHAFDVIAAACDDGTIRIVEVTVPQAPASILAVKGQQPVKDQPRRNSTTARINPSGIGAGLAGINRTTAVRTPAGNASFKHEWRETEMLPHADEAPVWKVRWSHDGSTLASTGDNGQVHLWRQSLDARFIEFSETGPA